METVFDHDPTKEELYSLFGGSEEEVRRLVDLSSQVMQWSLIARLYALRGEDELVDAYVDKIDDPVFKFNTLQVMVDLA